MGTNLGTVKGSRLVNPFLPSRDEVTHLGIDDEALEDVLESSETGIGGEAGLGEEDATKSGVVEAALQPLYSRAPRRGGTHAL